MNRNKIQDALQPLGSALHQDINLETESFDNMVREALLYLSESQKCELKKACEALLRKYTPAEINGFINRSPAQWSFNTKGAKRLVELIIELI